MSDEQNKLTTPRALTTSNVNKRKKSNPDTYSRQSMDKILHELGIHQIQLEVQKDELKSSKIRLEESESRYKKMYHFAPVAYLTFDRRGIITERNLKAYELLGINRGTTEEKPFIAYIHPEDHAKFFAHLEATFNSLVPQHCEIRINKRDGQPYFVRLSSMVLEGSTQACLTAIVDVDEIKKKEETISRMAYYDTLTGLPNRTLFIDRLTYAISYAKEHQQKVAVMFIDLDNFKKINDIMGHEVGDLVLREIASNMQKCMRDSDIIARMGGDEFTILFQGITEESELGEIAQRVLDTVNVPCVVNNSVHYMSASIGISVYPYDGENGEDLLKNADMAMYKSKSEGKKTFYFFNDDMKRKVIEKVKIERDLYEALEKDEISINYQPQIDIRTGKVRGVEALMRWTCEASDKISPEKFIPIAEETSLIIPYGDWILYKACATNKEWQDKGLPPIIMSVNMSYVQMKQEDIVDKIEHALHKTGLQPEYLELEVTESVLIEDADDMVIKLNRLIAMGVNVCLDDFGTGYSSLNYLNIIPLKTLKIDKTFIDNMNIVNKGKKLVGSIIELSHNLDIDVVAEGVESQEQLELLINSGCNYVQGYFFHKPMEPGEIEELLRNMMNE